MLLQRNKHYPHLTYDGDFMEPGVFKCERCGKTVPPSAEAIASGDARDEASAFAEAHKDCA